MSYAIRGRRREPDLADATCSPPPYVRGYAVPASPSRREVFRLNPGDWRTFRESGITLMELLVVLAIIGLLAAISLPAMRGFGQANLLASASRQVMDDLALARQLAIKERTTVHFVLAPTNVFLLSANPNSPRDQNALLSIQAGAYTTYALFAERKAGDQPGQPHFRYITSWRSLPGGTIFSPEVYQSLPYASLPFPTSDGTYYLVPHVAFSQQGSLVDTNGNLLPSLPALPIARGSVFAERDANGKVVGMDAEERPPGNGANNIVRITPLTGRAALERPTIQ